MAIANYFYNSLTRKYVTLFGSVFNKITIDRKDNSGTTQQSIIVPIMFAPWQKFLNKITQDPELKNKAEMVLPAMSFDMDGLTYDTNRPIHSQNIIKSNSTSPITTAYVPAPYTINFTLNIWVANMEDGLQIVEQILPYFRPDYTPSVFLLDNFDSFDIPIVLNDVSYEDLYEGDYKQRRVIKWNLKFTMNAWFFGPIKKSAIIKFIDTKLYSNVDNTDGFEAQIYVQPGLDINGNPTTDITETIPYNDINIDDNFDIITQIIENNIT